MLHDGHFFGAAPWFWPHHREQDVHKRSSKSLRAAMAHLKEELPAVRPGADLVPAVAWVGAAAVAMAA